MPGVRTTHQVKIGDDYFIVRPGSYRKRPAPLYGPRFTTGDPDYNNLSAWQHWVQKCWIGGLGAEEWKDDGMFDEAVGVDTTQHEVMMLARDMGPNTGTSQRHTVGNWDLDGEAFPREFFSAWGKLYCMSYGDTSNTPPGRLYVFDEVNKEWDLVHTFSQRVRSIEYFNDYLVVGGSHATSMFRFDSSHTVTAFNKPSGRAETPYWMSVYNDRLYVGFGKYVYRLKDDFTWDGSTAFFTSESTDYFTKGEVHLGFLYFCSHNGKIFRTDANNTSEMWSFGNGTGISALCSFDGRLFLGCTEPLDGTSAQQAVLYQFNGAAVTELKRWGKVGIDMSLGNIRVFQSRLMFGAASLFGMQNGWGVGVYDAREDAYSIWASSRETIKGIDYLAGTEQVNFIVDDLFYWKGWVYASVRGSGIWRTKWSYRDAKDLLAEYDTTNYGADPNPHHNGGWIISSDFDAGTPGLEKMWNAIILDYDLPHASTSIEVRYSLDGGRTWTEATTLSHDGTNSRYQTVVQLPNTVRGGRFKWGLSLLTTNSQYSPFVRGVIVRYLPIAEPGWAWDMTLVLSDTQQLLDETTEQPTNAAKLASLRTAFREQTLIEFTEPDGTVWATNGPGVLIDAMEELIPNIDASSKGALEYEVRITLKEMVEAYEAIV